MGLRDQILKRIEAKTVENEGLDRQIRENKAYIQGLQDTLKMLAKEPEEPLSVCDCAKPATLRAGSTLAQARDAIMKAGRPLHVGAILESIGRTNDNQSRVSLAGSLSSYVRKKTIFSRPAPNTFGLIELGHEGGSDQPELYNIECVADEEEAAVTN